MKNLLLLIAFVFTSQLSIGQGFIDRNYSDYLSNEDVTHVFLSGKLFDFASVIGANIEDEETKELSEIASKIESFSLIKVPKNGKATTDFKKGLKDIRGSYDELLSVRNEGEKFSVFVEEQNDVVYEFVGLGVVDDEFIAISLVGEFDLNKVAEIVNKIQSDESLSPLKRMADYNVSDLKVYPNPTTSNSYINIDAPEHMIGATATLIDVNGAKIKDFKIKSDKNSIDTNNLSPGKYFIALKKEGVTMKKHFVIIQ
ncbi:MAG: DUF4252 domain-containing protein [Saprospiraceae bacterium]